MKPVNSPPKWATRLFRSFCNEHLSEAVLGDLIDLYQRRCKAFGKRRADMLFIWNVAQFLQPFALRKKRSSSQNNISMYNNFITVAWRSMAKQKLYTSIKIGGFALGLATCIVIALFIRHELSYDRHYIDADNIYRIINHMEGPDDGKWTAFPAPFTPLLKSNFPEIELAARLIPYPWYNAGSNLLKKENEDDNFYEEGFGYADPDLLKILEVPMVYGNRETALSQPNSIVLSRRKAEKYFRTEDPTGKILFLNDDRNMPMVIGGVMENFPTTSHLQFDFFITLTGKEFWPGEQDNWCCWNYNPYVKLRPGTDVRAFEKKMLSIKKVYVDYLIKEKNQSVDNVRKYHKFILQPVKDIHLYSDGIGDIIPHGDIRYIWMFGAIAAFILILACINFVNLSTARSANRAKEIGLRKVVGSYRSSIVNQFLVESVIYSLSAFLIALVILALGMPLFNMLTAQPVEIPWKSWWFAPLLFVSSVLVGMIAGIYPSLYLSSFKPIDVLKGSIVRGFRSSKLRSAMVVFQFCTSIVLIIGTFTIYRQMNFILTTKVGFEKDNVLIVHGVNTLGEQMQTFKNELLQLSSVDNVSLTQYLPVERTKRDQNQFWRDGKSQEEKSVGSQVWWVDEDYINTLGMKLIKGRNFGRDLASDSTAIIVNEAMVKEFGFEDPIGQRIMNWRTWTIIGVVEDFHWENMKQEVRPVSLVRGNWGNLAAVKLNPGDPQDAIESVSRVWKRFMPHQSIRYSFMDDQYAQMYEDVKRAGNILASFSILAIIVACLGLFALSAYMVEQRTKEISIRLVLGASLRSIFNLLTSEFLKLVMIAFVLAVPIASYLMTKWLEDFKYKTTLGWDLFIVAGVASVLIALITVTYQSLRAAVANPATNLRNE